MLVLQPRFDDSVKRRWRQVHRLSVTRKFDAQPEVTAKLEPLHLMKVSATVETRCPNAAPTITAPISIAS